MLRATSGCFVSQICSPATSAARRPATPTSQGPDVLPVLECLDVVFFDTDRVRAALPRRARFNSDEALIEFADAIRMSEDRQILDIMIRRKTGEITLIPYRRAVREGGTSGGWRADPLYRRFEILRLPFQFPGQRSVFG
jgi:hypothetical protein